MQSRCVLIFAVHLCGCIMCNFAVIVGFLSQLVVVENDLVEPKILSDLVSSNLGGLEIIELTNIYCLSRPT